MQLVHDYGAWAQSVSDFARQDCFSTLMGVLVMVNDSVSPNQSLLQFLTQLDLIDSLIKW